ncbi:superoxide dismutase [Brevundimonas sp.]|uniref:superoxide dismutase n=1 Tax=Brevundimonas sp. TaxID=1871086 RepID=UPI003F70B3F8
MRKTALLTGVAGLLLMTAPAFAQDGTAAQTQEPAPATAAQPAAEQPTLTLQPGSDVKGSDGSVLGQLEGARNTEAGQELTVRGADGQLRGVPVSGGVRQDGEGVAVGWTSAQFSAAPSITDTAADVAEPAAPPMPDEAGMAPPTPPTLPPASDPADPAPVEGTVAEPDAPGA